MISDCLRNVVRRHPLELAIVDGDQRITYAELIERVQAARECLRSALDPQPGDVLALSFDNSWQFVACFFAAAELGCVLMPCNPQWRAGELRTFAGRLGFRGAVIEPRFTSEWNQILDAIPKDRVLTGDRIPVRRDPDGMSALAPIDSVSEDAPVLYLSTSGSTSAPRLSVRSHRNLAATAENVAGSLGIGPGRRFLSVLPFHSSHGLHNNLMAPLLSGATLVMMRQFSPGACAELMHREQVDTLFGSPFVYGYLVDSVRDPALLSGLKYCFSGGARIPSSVVERWRDRFGLAIRQTYGMSESGMIAADRTDRTPASSVGACIGQPIRGVEVIVLSAEGSRLDPGEIGELAIRSASVMSGYFGEPELSRNLFHDGFFRTGDLGCFDSAGNLHLTGRKGRLMNIAGVKVDPVEVERVVETLPNVASCHVDAVPNGRGSEVIRARVVPREGLSVTRPEVIEQCRRELAEYKLPRIIEFLEATPTTIAGKIARPAPDAGPEAVPSGEPASSS
jgi:acyl-CoA synthetase (AMP-forming)/AMP-acid ligase II